MPIKTSWVLEPRIRLQVYEGDISLTEVQAAVAEMEEIYDTHSQKIYTIIDSRKAGKMPTDIRALTRLARPGAFPSVGEIYNFGLDPVSRIISTSISRIANIPIVYVTTMEDALKRIREKDAEVAYLLDQQN